MRKRSKRIIVITVISLFIAAALSYVTYTKWESSRERSNPVNRDVVQIRIVHEYLNVRDKASFNSNVITQVKYGDYFDVLSIKRYSSGDVWIEIETACGERGFVSYNSEYNIIIFPDNYEGDLRLKIKIDVSELNVRARTDVSSYKIGTVYFGDEFYVYDVIESDGVFWYAIKDDNGRLGYICGSDGFVRMISGVS